MRTMKNFIAAILLAIVVFFTTSVEAYAATATTTKAALDTAVESVEVEVGQTFSAKDLMKAYVVTSPLYEASTAKLPTVESSKPSVLKVYSSSKIKALKKGKAKLTLKSGGKKKIVAVNVVAKEYSKTNTYKKMEKQISAFHKEFQKSGIKSSNCKTVITDIAKISQLTNQLAGDIFRGEYKKEYDKQDEEMGKLTPSYTIVDELKQPLYTDNYIDQFLVDAEMPLVEKRLISGKINTFNKDIAKVKEFLDKWNPFDERNKTAFQVKKMTQKNDTLKMTFKESVSNKQLLGSLTLYGSNHSISAWAYQLPQKSPTKQTIECEAWVRSLSGQKITRHYTGSYSSGTKTIIWEHDLSTWYEPDYDVSTDKLPEGDYVLLYAPKLNEEFTQRAAYNYYQKWKKAKTQADYDDIYEEFGSIGGMAHIGFYEFTVE